MNALARCAEVLYTTGRSYGECTGSRTRAIRYPHQRRASRVDGWPRRSTSTAVRKCISCSGRWGSPPMFAATLTARRRASTADVSTMESTAWALRIREAPGPSSIRAAIHSRTIVRSMPASGARWKVGRIWLSAAAGSSGACSASALRWSCTSAPPIHRSSPCRRPGRPGARLLAVLVGDHPALGVDLARRPWSADDRPATCTSRGDAWRPRL
jgi:hypothetical protein